MSVADTLRAVGITAKISFPTFAEGLTGSISAVRLPSITSGSRSGGRHTIFSGPAPDSSIRTGPPPSLNSIS